MLPFVLLIFHVLTVHSMEVSEEYCRKIPGWSTYTIGGPHETSQEESDVGNLEADRNEKNLRFRTCCDYKEKCSFSLLEIKNAAGIGLCGFDSICKNVYSGDLQIERSYPNGWKSHPYCQNIMQSSFGIPMKFCQGAGICFQNSEGKDDLLSCLDQLFGRSMDHAGFFTDALFPYADFWYKQRDFLTDIKYELTQTGTIVKTNTPYSP